MNLLLRKVLLAFAAGAGAVFVLGAPALIDAFEAQDWSNLQALAWALLVGALAGGFRALLALLTAFVPTDAQTGVNVVGKFKPDE
jgi:hypothetical protein